MPFEITSFGFFVFLAVALLIYYLLPPKTQWIWLLVSSFGFIYLATGLAVFPLLIIDILVVFFGARLIEQASMDAERKWLLCFALILIIAQLFALKYYNNLTAWLNRGLIPLFGIQLPIWENSWITPIGISYFSLSAIGYILDVYWKTYIAEKNPLKIALQITWFPALVSGPIVKYREQYDQLFLPHVFSYTSLKFGAERMKCTPMSGQNSLYRLYLIDQMPHYCYNNSAFTCCAG
ncbi:MAG: hypothetical protein LLF75_12970 [Eubacteriales bacterium]|nr:hypothetical protein [Eubacteriales bacterium]